MNYYDHSRIDNSVNFPSSIKVQEHKAPTDDSARLLNELTIEAKKNLIKTITINDNTINCAAMFFVNSPISFNLTSQIRFKLNGKEFTIINEMERFSLINPSHEDFLKHIYETISKNITIELMKEFQKEGVFNNFNNLSYYGH
jgi:hypothetical protein